MVELKTTQKKKKLWVPIVAPQIMQFRNIGEAYTVDPKSLIGKTISINLSLVTGDRSHKDFTGKFKITEVGDNAKTELMSFELSPSIVGRTIKKGRERVDDSFVVKTKDNIDVRVKPYFQTNGYIPHSVQRSLLKAIKEYANEFSKSRTYVEFARDVLGHKLQKEIKIKTNKITSIKFIEIRKFVKEIVEKASVKTA